MSNFDFTEIAGRYERDSLAQKAAAEVLISMLEIGPREDVLDLGCGTGHLTERLSEITAGRVVGVDPAPGMVAQARSNYCSERISFEIAAAENLRANAEFDVIFCNSALQWFRDLPRALTACKRALKCWNDRRQRRRTFNSFQSGSTTASFHLLPKAVSFLISAPIQMVPTGVNSYALCMRSLAFL